MGRFDMKGIELGWDHMTPARNPDWLVLRCSAAETLEYERELGDQGILVWAPSVWIRKRLPRRKLKVWAQLSLLPSYLFLGIRDVPKFVRLPRVVQNEFTPMTILGKYVVLEEVDLAGLRDLDQRERPRVKDVMELGEVPIEGSRVGQGLAGSNRSPGAQGPGQRPPGPFGSSGLSDLPEPGVDMPAVSWAVGASVRVKGILGGAEGAVTRVHHDGEYTVALKNSPAQVRVNGFFLEGE